MQNKEKCTSSDIKYGLWTLLLRTRQLMFKIRERELRECGLSPPGSGVLLTARRLGDKTTPSRISRELFMEPHSVSEQLKRMEKDGLIRRVKNQEKRNLVSVELTKKGLKAYEDSCYRDSINTMMSVLTRREQLNLWRLLSKLRRAALQYSGMKIKEADIFPPSDPEEFEIP